MLKQSLRLTPNGLLHEPHLPKRRRLRLAVAHQHPANLPSGLAPLLGDGVQQRIDLGAAIVDHDDRRTAWISLDDRHISEYITIARNSEF